MKIFWNLLQALLDLIEETRDLRHEVHFLRAEIMELREDLKPPTVSGVKWHFGPPEGE